MTLSKLEKISLGGLGLGGALTAAGIFADNNYLFALGGGIYAGSAAFILANYIDKRRELYKGNSTQSD